MAKNSKDLTPVILIHPGETLREELKARNIKQIEFAQIIGVTPAWINMLIKGANKINTKAAYLIAAGLNMDPDLWLNLQRNYEIDRLKKDKAFQKKLKAVGVRKWVVETK